MSRIFVAYGDCGTGGELDKLLSREGIERLPGAHCYAFYSGVDAFAARADDDIASFFLTDFLVRHFQSLVIRGLGLDRHPELRPLYFGNYRKVVYLSQLPTAELIGAAEAAAAALGLAFEHRPVGFGELARALWRLTRPVTCLSGSDRPIVGRGAGIFKALSKGAGHGQRHELRG